MSNLSLQEVDATVVTFDLRAFSMIAQHLGPAELGVLLRRFYTHAEEATLAGGGRVVKFMSDVVMSTWIQGEHGVAQGGYREGALAALRHARATHADFLKENTRAKLPVLSYSIAATSGRVLAGQIGTERSSNFDILGVPVNVALKLTAVATMRDIDNLVTADVLAGNVAGAVEVEPFALAGKRFRLYKVE